MIKQIFNNKKQYLDLLLLADEQENMIDKYLERGDMFALYDDDLKAICVVTDEGEGVCELQNIAVVPAAQRKGYGMCLVRYICQRYSSAFHTMVVGTGDSPLSIPFYQACGFHETHRIKNFFIENYDHPMFECGEQLKDKVYLSKAL